MQSKYKFICLLTVILLFTSSIISAETIILYGNKHKPPKGYIVDDKPVGILIDIVEYASKKMDIEFKVQLLPWKRAQAYAADGQGAIIGFARTPIRLETFEYAEQPMFIEKQLLITLSHKKFKFEKMSDLQGKKLGQIRGSKTGTEFEQAINNVFILEEFSSSEAILLALLHERVDVAIINPGLPALRMLLAKDEELLQNKDKFVALDNPIGIVPNHLAFAKHKNMTEFLERFSQTMKEGYESGDIPKIIEAYETAGAE